MGGSVHSKPYKNLLALMTGARERAGLTQAELAERIGQTQTFVSKCERGERRLDVIELVEFLIAMNIDPRSLLAQFIEMSYPDSRSIGSADQK
jgi:transcriptional regulator with XRE-family HTH domain